MQGIQGLLQLQAQLAFSAEQPLDLVPGVSCYMYTPSLREKLSPARYYTLLCIYYLKKPKTIHAYLQNQLPEQQVNLSFFLEALKALSYIFPPHRDEYNNLKQIYELISKLKDVKQCLASERSIPEEIGQTIEGLGKNSKDSKGQNKPIENPQNQNLGYTKIVLLFANFNENSSKSSFWPQITSLAGQYNLNYCKIFDIFINSHSITNASSCAFLFIKFNQFLTSGQVTQHLLMKLQNEYYQAGAKLTFRKNLSELQLQTNTSFQPPNQEIFKALSWLIKLKIAQIESIFPLLTPSKQDLANIQQKRVNTQSYYMNLCFKMQLEVEQGPNIEREVWGELLNSSKLQLLNHLLLINDFYSFKQAILKYDIKIDLIYHPRILITLCDLYEWIMQPLYEKLGITSHFKVKSKIKSFPEGYFKQAYEANNSFLQYISEIYNIAQSYIFSRKKVFVKTCRVFRQIFSKSSKLKHEQSKYMPTFTLNIIKRYLLHSIDYFDRDPSVIYEFDRLLRCFKFKIQFEIYTDCLKQRQLSNLHLSYFHYEVITQMVKYLNRLTDSDLVIKKINKLLICHVFPGFFEIFKRLDFISKEEFIKIIEAMDKTPKFNKKVALFFVFIEISQNEKDLIVAEREISKKYDHLINFTRKLLLFQRQNEDFIKLILQYITQKLSEFIADNRHLDNSSHFPREIFFLEGILEDLLPIDLEDCLVNEFDRKYLVGGPCLKIKIGNKIKEYHSSRNIRSNIVKCLFAPHLKSIFQNIFYLIILKLNTFQICLVQNLKHNIPSTAFLYDTILKLMLNIINIVHYETNSSEIYKYFKIKLFEPLVIFYHFPYEISFYIIRRSITQQMAREKYDWNEESKWLQLKKYFIPAFKKHFKESKSEVKGFECERYSEAELDIFLELDVFLIFWIQDIEYSLFLPIYSPHIIELEKDIQQKNNVHDSSIKQFCSEMTAEKNKFASLHYGLTYEKDQKHKGMQRPRQKYNERFIIFMNEQFNLQEKYSKFCKMFIKYCIIPRAMLNKSECYYSWCFYLHFLKQNKLPIDLTVKLICHLAEGICRFVPYSTERESTQLLPLIYNSSMAIFTFWSNFSRFNDKLEKSQLLENRLSYDAYNDILYLLYQSQTSILSTLFESKQEIISVKNCMNFLFKCQAIPFCEEHGQIIRRGFNEIKNQYKDSKDVIVMIQTFTKQFQNKLSLARSITKNTKNYDSRQSFRGSPNLNQTNLDIFDSEDAFHPMKDYPNLSTSIDYQNEDFEKANRKSYKKKETPKNSRSVMYSYQKIDDSPKIIKKQSSTTPQKKQQSKSKGTKNKKK